NIDLQSDLVKSIIQKLKAGKSISEKLPSQGKLRIDNNLPFLLIYRYRSLPLRQTARLVMGESSYFISSGNQEEIEENRKLLMAVSKNLSVIFGAVMVLEIWEGQTSSREFQIKAPKDLAQATVETLSAELSGLSQNFPGISVKVVHTNTRQPEGLDPLLSISQCQEVGCFLIGLEILPFNRSVKDDEFFYLYYWTLKKKLSSIFRKTIFEFIRTQTSSDIDSYHALGSRTLEPVVWEVDNQLADIEQTYRFLLLISPINTLKARDEFAKNNLKKNPEFLYRILPIDPDHLKEQLYQIK